MPIRPSESQIATAVQVKPTGSDDGEGSYVIAVVEGPDRGRKFVLDGSQASRALVGQSPACDLRLADPEVSRRHAAIQIADVGLRITDLGSTNGTFVDRVKIIEAELLGGEMVRLGSTVLAIEHESTSAAAAPPPSPSFGRLLGASREMRRLFPLCERLAASIVPVVIEGETGTGKEVLAEALHEMGPRASAPFIVFDCTTSPPNLVESELFGHERGSFTGAVGQRRGVFEQAHGGTLLIDEIGDLDLSLQPKLLRAIERGEIRRIGGDRWIRVDARVLAATRRDLDREVQAGRFRDDLFHRLAVARIELPPLRDRTGDIPHLVRHFWREQGGDEARLSAALLQKWTDYKWPGNVRELRNAVARQLALGELTPEPSRRALADEAPTSSNAADGDAPRSGEDTIERVVAAGLPFIQARERVMDEFVRRYVAHVLEQHGGDGARAAAASGIGRRYFQMLRARKR